MFMLRWRPIRGLLASVLLVASLVLAAQALALQFVTLATNDPHDYQQLLTSGLVWSAYSVAAQLIFVPLARNRWRWAALLPLFLCGWAWWGIARMWPHAFA